MITSHDQLTTSRDDVMWRFCNSGFGIRKEFQLDFRKRKKREEKERKEKKRKEKKRKEKYHGSHRPKTKQYNERSKDCRQIGEQDLEGQDKVDQTNVWT